MFLLSQLEHGDHILPRKIKWPDRRLFLLVNVWPCLTPPQAGTSLPHPTLDSHFIKITITLSSFNQLIFLCILNWIIIFKLWHKINQLLKHTSLQLFKRSRLLHSTYENHVFRNSSGREFKCSKHVTAKMQQQSAPSNQVFKCSSVQAFKCSSV